MKSFKEPRAVLAMNEGPDADAVSGALLNLGIEAYRAAQIPWAVSMAARADTLVMVYDATVVPREQLLADLRAIRERPESRDVLLVVLLPLEAAAQAETYSAAGANLVEQTPLTPAKATRILLRLLRQARFADEEAAKDASIASTPMAALLQRATRRRGRHKIYVGAAPGVGKTYAMLREAHDRKGRGEDVVIGLVETHGRHETAQLVEGLEMVPRLHLSYKGTTLTEMDLDGILARRPGLVLVDELAHTNVPGSLNAKRYEDVQVIRLAGLPVISTLNIQHIESLNDIVERITGIKVRETVPDSVLEDADELVLVDISPEALQERLQAGQIYAQDKVTQSLGNFFTTHNLTALREMVLREVADKVDVRLEAVRADIGKAEEPIGIQERVLICLTPTVQAQRLVRRGARLADRLNAELSVLFVEDHRPTQEEEKILAQNFSLAETLEAETARIRGLDVGQAIARYAAEHQITLILLGESRRSRVTALFRSPILDAILHATSDIDVVTVASQE
ncbi:MAG TPA: universal stress protein [Pantanalinema sp.]